MMQNIATLIATELNIDVGQVTKTLSLLDEGATVAFIARYRKDATGNLDDIQLRKLAVRLQYLREVESRQQSISDAIEAQGKLTESLKKQIGACINKAELEDLYNPYKKKRHSKAQVAREAGLQVLADKLRQQPNSKVAIEAKAFINPNVGLAKISDVLAGVQHIIIEEFAENPIVLKAMRKKLFKTGVLHVKKASTAGQDAGIYRDYFDYEARFNRILPHRALAIFRGKKSKNLRYKLVPQHEDSVLNELAHHCGVKYHQHFLWECVEQCWQQKLGKSIETALMGELWEQAEAEAIEVFANNLHELLMAPPAGAKTVLAIDPGIRTGCKLAVLSETGRFLASTVIYPHQPRHEWQQSIATLHQLCEKYRVDLIAVGNGTASRESDKLVRELIKQYPNLNLQSLLVSEAGASIYSASEVASKEFPDLDVTIRGAVSIGRRLQDPLAELVKIEPQSIGVGQYQHDVNSKLLHQRLDSVVEDCVNQVGVDLNMASSSLLQYVSGLNAVTANNIVELRQQLGRFDCRSQLKKVPRLGLKAFEHCAGFLRIANGKQALDNSALHPESYAAVSTQCKKIGVNPSALIKNAALVDQLDIKQLAQTVGKYTAQDIISELRKPRRDPRPEFKAFSYVEGVEKISDLKVGQSYAGIVTNVTSFGAFIDIGVHQDGLCHISQLADKFVENPQQVVKAGQQVNARVVEIDEARKRISLSMKANNE